MTTIARRPRTINDVFGWLQDEFPVLPALRAQADRMIRMEEYAEEGTYVLRAELPGIDPRKDVKITIQDGVLDLTAERRAETETGDGRRSEFHYGLLSRSMPLPAGSDEDDVTATYKDGILEIRIAVKEAQHLEPKQIPVTTA